MDLLVLPRQHASTDNIIIIIVGTGFCTNASTGLCPGIGIDVSVPTPAWGLHGSRSSSRTGMWEVFKKPGWGSQEP